MNKVENGNLPTVSVIIPMRNEEKHISRCLQSVVEQEYPSALMEVLVIDGMSEDGSRSIVLDYVRKYPFLRLLDNPKRAATYGLNMGIAESKGEIIVRVDAHCSIMRDYVDQCVEALQKTGAANVGGLMRPVGRTFLEKAISLAMSCPFGVGGGRFHYSENEMFVDTVYLGAYRRGVFSKIGLYDEEAHYSEDDELNYRLMKSGGRSFLSPRIRSEYYPRSSLSALWRQYYNYGRGKVRTIRNHGRPASWSHLVPAAFVCSVIGSFMLSAVNPLFVWLSLGILGTYSLLAVVFSARICKREGWKYFCVLLVVFATLHLSYGLGFLMGTFRMCSFEMT